MSYLTLALEESPRYENAPVVTPYRVSTQRFWFPVTSGMISAGVQNLDRSTELRNLLAAPQVLIDGYEPTGSIAERAYFNNLAVLLELCGLVATITPGAGTNEVQTISTTGVPTGGTFTLTFEAQTTGPIAYNATAATLQAALEALAIIGEGGVRCTGGPLPTGIAVNFEAARAAENVGPITFTSSLTGGSSPNVVVAQTTSGAPGAVLDPDGKGIPTGAFKITYAKRATAIAQTAEIIAAYTEQNFFLKGQGYAVSQIGMNAAGELTAELMGLVVKPFDDPVLAPAFDAPSVLPGRRGDLQLTWRGGASAPIQDFSFQIANAVERGENLAIQSYFMKEMEHTGQPTMLTGSINTRRINRSDYEAMLYAQAFTALARWITPKKIGASGKRYGLWVEMPAVQQTGGDPEALSNARRFPAQFTFGAYIDEATGKDFTVTLVCGVSSLKTYV